MIGNKKIWRWLLAGVVLFSCAVVLMAWLWPEKFLTVEQKPEKADAIVMLGGESFYRPARAMELFRQGLAPLVVVTGKGDVDEMRYWFEKNGLPMLEFRAEADSTNTWQNARFTVLILRKMKMRKVILVTSWYHSRRALACFRKAAPEIKFISLPTVADRPSILPLTKKERGRYSYEYLKLAGYTVRYGINPLD